MKDQLECRQVSKHFGNVKALDSVDVNFEKGKITGLVGRNGAGKTTLLNVIANRLPADRGGVMIDGIQAFEHEEIQQQLFYMSVTNFFPQDFRVKKGFAAARLFLPHFDEQAAAVYAKMFEIPLKHRIAKLSTGMQSLFKLCVALASNADYLLLDEPVLGLDANNRDLFYRLLIEKTAERGCGIVLSTHLIEEVAPLLERIVLIDHGRIKLDCEVDDLLDRYYLISGAEEPVRSWAEGKEHISSRHLGNYLTLGLAGHLPDPDELPEGTDVSRYTLQQLIVDLSGPLTGSGRFDGMQEREGLLS